MADSLKRKIGYAMLAAPFAGLAIFLSTSIGVLPTLGLFVGVAALVAWLTIAGDMVA